MKNTTNKMNLDKYAPIYVGDYGNYEACLCIDKEDNECWADTRPKASYSPQEWDGTIDRIVISRDFITLDQLNSFIDDVLEYAEKYANGNDSDKYNAMKEIQERSYEATQENIICTCYKDYADACNLTQKEVLEQIIEAGNLSRYIDYLLEGNSNLYFTDRDEDTLLSEIVEYLK